jgi:hypothetical protein
MFKNSCSWFHVFWRVGFDAIQVLFQAEAHQMDERLLSAAQELDVFLDADPTGLDRLNIRLTSYERNASKFLKDSCDLLLTYQLIYRFTFRGPL